MQSRAPLRLPFVALWYDAHIRDESDMQEECVMAKIALIGAGSVVFTRNL